MYASLKNLLVSPRVWLCAGLLNFGIGIAVGYHQDQLAAQNALAQKIALPFHEIVQDASSSRDVRRLNEVSGSENSDYSEMRRILFGTSAMMILLGLALLFSLLPSLKAKKKADVTYEVKAVGSFPAVNPFQPIAAREEKEKGDSAVQRVSRILGSTALMFRIKSRQ